MFIDIHQDPNTIYPGTGFVHQIGEGEGKGFTVNIPMPVGAGNDSYELVFDSIASPITSEFQPQIIIRNGGSDPHLYDGLTDLGLTIEEFRMIGERVRELSTICGDRVIDLIASGYDRQILPLGLTSGLKGINMQLEEPERISQQYMSDSAYIETERVVDEVKDKLKERWSCLR